MGAISCLTSPLSAKILLATDFHSYPNPILDLETGVLLSFDGPIPDRHSGPAKRQLRGQTSKFGIDKTEATLVLSRADSISLRLIYSPNLIPVRAMLVDPGMNSGRCWIMK